MNRATANRDRAKRAVLRLQCFYVDAVQERRLFYRANDVDDRRSTGVAALPNVVERALIQFKLRDLVRYYDRAGNALPRRKTFRNNLTELLRSAPPTPGLTWLISGH